MRLVPVDAKRQDWPRLVAGAVNSVITGRGKVAVRSVSATGAVGADDGLVLVDATAGVVAMTLPPADSVTGRIYAVKKIDASVNAVTVDGNGAETIDGAATQALTAQYDAITLVSDGATWWIQ